MMRQRPKSHQETYITNSAGFECPCSLLLWLGYLSWHFRKAGRTFGRSFQEHSFSLPTPLESSRGLNSICPLHFFSVGIEFSSSLVSSLPSPCSYTPWRVDFPSKIWSRWQEFRNRWLMGSGRTLPDPTAHGSWGPNADHQRAS